ncbi:7503_t:CDS:10 [Entrophospora sp. SA101]|nr:7503_t:CDS:10 [Entrophospora sp. SA101]
MSFGVMNNLHQNDGRQRVWHLPKEKYDVDCLVPTFKHGGGDVMVWGCFVNNCLGPLVVIDGKINDLFDSDDNFEQENIKDIVLESNNSTSNTNDSISEIRIFENKNNSARSWTWLFFDCVQDENTIWAMCQIPNDLGEVCKHHVKIINGSTGNSINHLSNVHGITKENYKEKNNFSTKQKSQLTLPNLFSQVKKHSGIKQDKLPLIHNAYSNITIKFQDKLAAVNYVSLTTDLWTSRRKGLNVNQMKIFIGRVKKLINFFISSKQSERLEKIQKENYKISNENIIEYIKTLITTIPLEIDDPNSKSDYKRLKSVFLTDDEWLLMSDLVQILGPFAEATDLLGGSKYSTFSLIYPTLMALINQLTSDQNNDDDFNVEEESDVFHKAKGLADLIKERLYFALIYYYEKPIQDALIASLLDPRSKCLRFLSQERKSNVIITNLRKEFNYLKNLNNSLQNNSQNTERNLTSKPYKRSLLTIILEKISKKRNDYLEPLMKQNDADLKCISSLVGTDVLDQFSIVVLRVKLHRLISRRVYCTNIQGW